jgi:hypothetical protein
MPGRPRRRCTPASAGSHPWTTTEVGALVEHAIACGDEHGIKFTEVCLREHALASRPAFLAAAAHAVEILDHAA